MKTAEKIPEVVTESKIVSIVPETITDLLPQTITATTLFSEKGLDPVLNEIKKKVDAFEPDIETATGRKEIASFAYKIAQSKTFLDGLGKDLVASQKATIKLVDAERKRARDFLDAEKERARKPLTEWEEAEKALEEQRRQEKIFQMDWDEALQMDDLFNRERDVKRKEAEFARIAEEKRQKEESERIEKERIEREERLKKEAAEQARLEAEQQIKDAEEKLVREKAESERKEREAKEAAEQAERDRIAAEERAKLERERAEQAKIEAARQAEIDKQAAILEAKKQAENEARIKQEEEDRKAAELKAIEEKKAANKRHQAHINNKIMDAFSVLDIPKPMAKKIIIAIVQGKIPNVTINY